MPKKRRLPVESVHQRAQREIREARTKSVTATLRTPEKRVSTILDETPNPNGDRPVAFTFNWRGAEKSQMFVPDLVKDKDMESLRREFINSVARGESSSNLDERVLRNPQQFFQDTMEGIHRWHTFPSKERR